MTTEVSTPPPQEATLRGAFDRLQQWLEEHDCGVEVGPPLTADEVGCEGCFLPPPQDPGVLMGIHVTRAGATPGPADRELATLAHEAGHWRSWKLEQRPDEATYRAAVDQPPEEWPSLSAWAKNMILGEEVAAWHYGREVLSEAVGAIPDEFWAFYEQRAAEALDDYHQRLGIRVVDAPPSSLDADDALIVDALGVAIAIRRAARKLADRTLPAQERDRLASDLRAHVRTERGIPEHDQRGYAPVVVLNLEAWINQARTEGHAANWLQRRCMAVDARFGAVPLSEFQGAISGTKATRPGPQGTQTFALALAKAAGIRTTLGAVRNLKAASKHLNQPSAPSGRAPRNTSRKR